MSGRPARRGRPQRRGRKRAAFKSETHDVTIQSIGARGDGLADLDGKRLYVPYTVPGDHVRVRTVGPQGDGIAAQVQEILVPGDGRVTPSCPRFGTCGGCALQHLSNDAYTDWKRAQVVDALSRRGLEAAVAPVSSVPAATRRRVAWQVDAKAIGFSARASHTIVPIDACPLLVAPLNDLLAALSEILPHIKGCEQVQATAADNGIDMLLTGPSFLDLTAREALAAFADAQDLARLSWREDADGLGEPLSQRRVPLIGLSGTDVSFPSGAFLQPSREGEEALSRPVVEWLAGAKSVADLFAGLGTFACALVAAGDVNVHAVETDGEVLGFLAQGAGRAKRGGRISCEVRDLFQQPLMAKELAAYDGVVFDPPRAGAKEQAVELAATQSVTRVAAVSCNPSTLARDVRILVDGGFTLRHVIPVDQFPFAAHVEVVALLERA